MTNLDINMMKSATTLLFQYGFQTHKVK